MSRVPEQQELHIPGGSKGGGREFWSQQQLKAIVLCWYSGHLSPTQSRKGDWISELIATVHCCCLGCVVFLMNNFHLDARLANLANPSCTV